MASRLAVLLHIRDVLAFEHLIAASFMQEAGLAIGYYLGRAGLDFTILDANDELGGSWRQRWDSLRLFTPAELDGLPELPFPAADGHYPSKDEMAAYLVAYRTRFDLPVQVGMAVESLCRSSDRYLVRTAAEELEADHVVVATGAYRAPHTPAFAAELDPAITQLHSSVYRNPGQLQPGGVLVVGAGNSGAEIAIELASGHPTWLSGRDVGRLPKRIFGRPIHWWLYRSRYLTATRDSWLGRRLHAQAERRGVPLIGIGPTDFAAVGVSRVPRTVGTRHGLPLLEDGRDLEVRNVIWCTGYRPDFGWIRLPMLNGNPTHYRRVAHGEPGLYFTGLVQLHRLDSSLIAGAGYHAAVLARQIIRRHRKALGAE